jgi:co-chaperonin GroES (HSP10)
MYFVAYTNIKANTFTPLKDKVFVTAMEHGDKISKGGLIVVSDDMTNRGIRPRWGKVWAIGPDVQDLNVGNWILIEHGRWTQKINIEVDGEEIPVWSVEYPKSVLMVSDDEPDTVTNASIPNRNLEFATRKR